MYSKVGDSVIKTLSFLSSKYSVCRQVANITEWPYSTVASACWHILSDVWHRTAWHRGSRCQHWCCQHARWHCRLIESVIRYSGCQSREMISLHICWLIAFTFWASDNMCHLLSYVNRYLKINKRTTSGERKCDQW